MKNIYTYLAGAIIILFTSCTTSRDYAQSYEPESAGITYQQFYDDLSPYGDWVDYRNYGYVWVPNEQGFRPYYNNGHWIYTSYGWTWVSGYNWGWAPFHYGRWLYDDLYGWMWVPGYDWAPAWVSWRSGGGCYGWAPLAPGFGFDVGIGSIPYSYWAFVPHRYINSPRINNYYIDRGKNVTIINNTTVIKNTNVTLNKTVYVTGPSAIEVEKVTNEKIRPVKIVQTNTPGNTKVSGSTVSIYKPAVKETPQQNGQIKPPRVVKLDALKVHREDAGALQNETPGKKAQANTVPANINTEPVVNPQKNNNNPVVNDKPNPVVDKPAPITNKPATVTEKQVQAQQPVKVVPNQQEPVIKREIINTEKSNQIQKNQENNAGANQQPINPPPVKVRVINTPNNNPGNNRQDNSPAPIINRQPVKIQETNTDRPQRVPAPVNRQSNASPVTPVIRNPNPTEPRVERREIIQKERK